MAKTLEELLRTSPLQMHRDYAAKYAVVGDIEYFHPNGASMTRNQLYRYLKRNEDTLDRLSLEMATYERSQLQVGETLPPWIMTAEGAAFFGKKYRRING